MPTIHCSNGLAAFLDLIAASEGTSTSTITKDNGYDVIVSGADGPHSFSDYSIHPFSQGRAPILVRGAQQGVPNTPAAFAAGGPLFAVNPVEELRSTASGRYQITLPTWEGLTKALGLGTFSPAAQDLAGIELLRQASATDLIIDGQIATAITRCSYTWASFPGNDYRQGTRSIAWLLSTFNACLEALANK